MKKLLTLILVALMLFSITACDTTQGGITDGDDNTKDTVSNDNDGGELSDSSNNGNAQQGAIKIGGIVTGYHEGLMFTENTTNLEMHTIFCIDNAPGTTHRRHVLHTHSVWDSTRL